MCTFLYLPFTIFAFQIKRRRINVTFWNTFAEEFEDQLSMISEDPKILIIASGRVTSWNGNITFTIKLLHPILYTNLIISEEIDICNYSATKFYLNYDHHSVQKLRKM